MDNKNYEAPVVEVLEVVVEKGFAVSSVPYATDKWASDDYDIQ